MNLLLHFEVSPSGSCKGRVTADGRAIIDMSHGVRFAEAGVLTPDQKLEAVAQIAALQQALTCMVGDLMDAKPAKAGGTYVE